MADVISEDDEDTKALIRSLDTATDLDEEDRALLNSIKKDYGMVDTPKLSPKKSILERGMNKVDQVGSAINQGVETFAAMDVVDDFKEEKDPVRSAAILGSKGLKKAADTAKPYAEKMDSILGAFQAGSSLLKKIDKKAAVTFDAGTHPIQALVENAAGLIPRTPAQAAFAGLTLPFAEIEGIGNAATNLGKKLMPKAAAQAEKTALGAMRKVSELYPESKLARMLDKVTEGSTGEQRFNLINESAVNTSERVLQKAGMEEAEMAAGDSLDTQITDKLKQDVDEINTVQASLEAAEKKGRLGTLESAMEKQQALREELLAKQAEVKALAEEKHLATKMAEANKAAIEADIAVNKALGLANKDAEAMAVGRATEKAHYEAVKAVDGLYAKQRALGDLVTADTTALNESFGEMRRELVTKLKVIPEDTRAQKILGMLEEGTEESHLTDEGIHGILKTKNLPKATKRNAEVAGQRATKSLSDLMQLYSDLRVMSREKGDRMYSKAAYLVRKHIRTYEGVPWTKAVVDSWDAARGSQMHLTATFENKTVEALLKTAREGSPGTVFQKLIEHSDESTMPLSRFMKVAPEEARNIIRRESLSRGFDAINKAKPGKAAEALDAFIEKVGQGNVDILHKGTDLDGMYKLASYMDSSTRLADEAPTVARQIKTTQAAITDLIESTKKSLLDSDAVVSKAKNTAWDKTKKLSDAAYAARAAERVAVTERIAKGLEAIDKALPLRVKTSTRAGEVGELIFDGLRKDDDNSSTAITAGAGGLALSYGLHSMGFKQMGYATGGVAASGIMYGLAKKAPGAMSKLYYSEGGRALITKVASAPNPAEAAKALLELGDALKNPGAYLMIKPQMNDKPGQEPPKKPGLGKLEGLRGRNAAESKLINHPNDPLQEALLQEEPVDDETYEWPVR